MQNQFKPALEATDEGGSRRDPEQGSEEWLLRPTEHRHEQPHPKKTLWSKWNVVLFFLAAILQYYLLRSFYALGKSYGGILKPSLHFAPPHDWLNDPNGLFIDSNRTWHMYFQYNPTTYEPSECKDWGHATSKDLYTWTLHPVALSCDEYSIYSGSIVVDKNNTSGLFPKGHTDGVVAIYTQHHLTSRTEEQAIAYSSDGGYTFKKYAKNPVLKRKNGSYEFRDPKVIWHEATKKWIMTVAKAAEQVIGFYTSTNLIDWTAASEFRNPQLSESRPSFECPNLVPVPLVSSSSALSFGTELEWLQNTSTYVLLISSGGGSPLNGGSVTRYFPGSFNGTHFEAIDDRADRVIDFGPDNYASQYFFGLLDDVPLVSLGWAANLAYAGGVPTGPREGWRGMLTGPRIGLLARTLDGEIEYLSQPVGLDRLRAKTLAELTLHNRAEVKISYAEVKSGTLLLEASFEMGQPALPLDPMLFEFGFMASESDELIWCEITFGRDTPSLICDRSVASSDWGISPPLTTMSVPEIPGSRNETMQSWNLQAIIDRSILEVYLNGGLKAGTMTFFPSTQLDFVYVRSSMASTLAKVEVRVQELNARQNEILIA